jgi:hypothetical protein
VTRERDVMHEGDDGTRSERRTHVVRQEHVEAIPGGERRERHWDPEERVASTANATDRRAWRSITAPRRGDLRIRHVDEEPVRRTVGKRGHEVRHDPAIPARLAIDDVCLHADPKPPAAHRSRAPRDERIIARHGGR